MVAELLQIQCGPLCSSIFPICTVQCTFSWNLDTKFCLHAAGGIYVSENFEHSGGKIEVSNSSAEQNGGAVLKDEDEEDETSADGGAIYVGGNLTVTGNLSIHNCSADYGGSLA